ncbi:hypothetical protein [Leifsonia shinshuensis]
MRSSPRRILAALAVTGACVVALAGCTPQPLPGAAPTGTYSPGPCPSSPSGTLSDSGVPGADQRIVPFTPTGFRVCRYGALPSRALQTGVVVDDPARAARVASFLDSTGRHDTGAVNCPMDDGEAVEFTFWSGASHLAVTLGLTGCRIASNGSTFRLDVEPTPDFLLAAGLPSAPTP